MQDLDWNDLRYILCLSRTGRIAGAARKLGVNDHEVYDGRGEGKRWREYQAREAGKVLILTSVRCKAMGHRIRTRAGNCAQCNPASIGFTERETANGYV
jgi:T5orf172 domain